MNDAVELVSEKLSSIVSSIVLRLLLMVFELRSSTEVDSLQLSEFPSANAVGKSEADPVYSKVEVDEGVVVVVGRKVNASWKGFQDKVTAELKYSSKVTSRDIAMRLD